jgi:hypothetical protein
MPNKCLHYFLGANTAGGFYSLYDKLLPPEQARRIFILKGGPGSGVSALIRKVGEAETEKGEDVEYIHSAGAPEALDAVYFPGKKCAVIDGGAPHVIEPFYPGVAERYVDLSCCYDMDALQEVREEIITLTKARGETYQRVIRCLKAQEEMNEDIRTLLYTSAVKNKIPAGPRES